MDTRNPSIPVFTIGLNHKLAPVEVRERLAFGPEQIPAALADLRGDDVFGIQEAVLLSTCNRSEIYVCIRSRLEAETRLLAFLAQKAELSVQELRRFVYSMQGDAAVEHLMQVACGLDSLVLGENEILGQVREAAELAQAAGMSGPILSALFRSAIKAGKRARTETEIGRGDVSVASVVVEMAAQAFGKLHDRTVLLIGAGKISALTAQALVKAGLRCVMVANRTFDRAQKLAQSLNGAAVRFDALEQVLEQADIVICSTGAPHIVLHAEMVARTQRARGGRPLLVLDLAVPRDADPEMATIPGVTLANIDQLDQVVKYKFPLTVAICQQVETIVQHELEKYYHWCLARRCAPLIRALNNKAEKITQAEVEQTLRRLGPLTPHQERLVQALGQAIAGKLLHEPIVHIREMSAEEDLTTYLEVVQDLYGIK